MNRHKISFAGIALAFGALLASDALVVSAATPVTPPADAVMQGYESYNSNEKVGWYYLLPDGSTEYAWTDQNGADASTLIFGWMKDDRICGVSSKLTEGRLYYYQYLEIDPLTGEYYEARDIIPIDPSQGIDFTRYYRIAAYVPSEDRIYGYGYDARGENFVFKSSSLDFTDTRIIREIPDEEYCSSLTYNESEGRLIGFNRVSFVDIDMLTGQQTRLYTPTFTTPYQYTFTALAYDRASSRYYWNYFTSDNRSHLATVDINGKSMKVVKDYTDMTLFTVLVPMPRTADPDAPEEAVFNEVSFPQGALSGSVSFTLPAEKVAGEDFTWTLSAAGATIAEGTGKPGEKITVPVNDMHEGMTVFSVVVGVGNHLSLPAEYPVFIGIDTPATPQNVVLKGTSLTWNAVTAGSHGGYINADDVTYNVYLENQFQGSVTDTSFEVTYPAGVQFTSFQASVVAVSGDKESLAGVSNVELTGEPLKVPVVLEPTDEQAPLFSSVDVDGNGNEWTLDNSVSQNFAFVSGYSSSSRVDEWLFLPPVAATDPDAVYQFQLRAGLNSDSPNRALLYIKAGTEATPEAMKYDIVNDLPITESKLKTYTGLFNPTGELEGAEKVVIGIRVFIPDGGSQVRVRNFQVKKTNISADAPAAVSAMRVAAGEKGALEATVSFRLPSMTLNGVKFPDDAEITAVVTGDNNVTVKGAPGTTQSVKVEAYQGLNEFTVTPKYNNLSGAVSKAEVYCGIDRPTGVVDMKVDVAEDNLSAVVTWEAPELGLNGGYINPDDVTYDFCLYNAATGAYDPYESLGKSKTYVMQAAETLANYRFAIQSNTVAGATSILVGERVQLGKPYSLPMVENFLGDGGKAQMHYSPYTLVTSEEYANTSWSIGDPGSIREEYAVAAGVALIGSCAAGQTTGYFEFPKFTTNGSESLKMLLRIYRGKSSPKVKIYGKAYGMSEYELVETIAESDEAGYQDMVIPFPDKFANAGWVSVYMSPEYETTIQNLVIQQFRIEAEQSSVEEMNASKVVVTTGKGTLTITGADGNDVVIYAADGRTVATFTATDNHRMELPSGIYMVRIGNRTFKTAVR